MVAMISRRFGAIFKCHKSIKNRKKVKHCRRKKRAALIKGTARLYKGMASRKVRNMIEAKNGDVKIFGVNGKFTGQAAVLSPGHVKRLVKEITSKFIEPMYTI
jgi:hypothetical protein